MVAPKPLPTPANARQRFDAQRRLLRPGRTTLDFRFTSYADGPLALGLHRLVISERIEVLPAPDRERCQGFKRL